MKNLCKSILQSVKIRHPQSVVIRLKSVVIRVLASRLSNIKLQVALIILVIFTPIAILTLKHVRPAVASWFDDSFSYRNSIAITSHTAAESNVYISTTIDTSASGQFQADCGDLRFTDYAGNLLPYYISSGCVTATTVIHVFFQSFPAGAQTIYYYYGNPTADNGFSSADFTTEATGYVIGATGSQEKGGAPVAYWKFDDGTGTNAQDSSPNNNDGTISGATWQTSDQCVSEKCLYFDGTNDVVTVANSVAGVQSVSFWVRPITTTEQFVDLNGSATLLASSGTITASGFTSPTIYVDGRVSSTIAANKWQHVEVTTGTAISGSAIKVGQISTNYGQAFFDDVKIYNYARTAAQVKSDFAGRGSSKGVSSRTGSGIQSLDSGSSAGMTNGLVGYWKMDEATWTNDCSTTSVTDSSGNGNNGKSCPNGTGISTPAAGKFGLSGSFDGVDDYATVPYNSTLKLANTGTIAAWHYPRDITTNSTHVVVTYGGSPNDYGTGYLINQYGSTLYVYWNNGSPKVTITNFFTSANTWYHVSVVNDNGSLSVYKNGALAGTGTSGGAITANYTTDIGGTSGDWFNNSSIDEVRIYNRALSPKEVRDLYNWAPGPRVYLKMEEGSGTSTSDDSGNARTGTLNGNPLWAPGKYGKGVKLDGTGDYTQVTDF